MLGLSGLLVSNALQRSVSILQRRSGTLYRKLPTHNVSKVRVQHSSADAAAAASKASYEAGAVGVSITARQRKVVGWWLAGCAGMCFGAVVLGGVTRLTESGLSMVNWNLIKDMTPPRSEQAWREEFAKYQRYPEYQHILSEGRSMGLSDFKFIYYMEFAHRMWGRATGMVFLLPAAFFLARGWVPRRLKPRLGILAGLLGFQGFLGWYMVKSGLEAKEGPSDVPRVSQYRLASHLGSAFILYTLFLWNSLTLLLPNTTQTSNPMRNVRSLQKYSHGVVGLIFFTAMSGAFVAGLDAGLVYNTWPKMADRWIPSDLLTHSPKWKNFLENPTTVQFDHRHLGELTAAVVTGFWLACRKAALPPRARLAANCMMGMVLLQVALGITTLLTYVPTPTAAAHQSGSLVLLSFATWLMHELKRLPK